MNSRYSQMKRIPFLFALSLLAGCGAAHYAYPPYETKAQPYGKVLSLRLAIAYPEEGRGFPARDEDLEPIVTSRCAELPTYISPRLEISRGLLEELRATRAFRVLHWAPESSDDYDLVVRMKLVSGGKLFKSDTCPAMLGPSKWDLVVTDQRGRELERRSLTLAKTKLLARSPAAEFRKDEQAFLAEAVKLVLAAADSMAAAAANLESERRLHVFYTRDPALRLLREKVSAAHGADPLLEREYLLRIGALESARVVEEKTIIAHQALNDKAWADIQDQFRVELRELGENVSRMLAEKLSILLDGIAGASGLLPGVAPVELRRAAALARGGMAARVQTPDRARTLKGALPRDLMPGNSLRIPIDAEFAAELARIIRGPLRAPVPGAEAALEAGCMKDTDCKGERICVARECLDAPP